MSCHARHILLVEDNPMDVDLTRRVFLRKKITSPIEVARDGAEALEWIKRWEEGEPTPSIILLDLKLPRVGGLEVLRRIKSHPQFYEIPVFVLTTSTEESDMKAAFDLRADLYLFKPVKFDDFVRMAEKIEEHWKMLHCSEVQP